MRIKLKSKRLITTGIALAVGALHFITGEDYRGPFPIFVNGYLIDILLPMSLYLLLGLVPAEQIRAPGFRSLAVFVFGCVVETSQYLGHPFFGSTFDLLDIFAYAGGVILGLFLDLVLLPRIVPRWNDDLRKTVAD